MSLHSRSGDSASPLPQEASGVLKPSFAMLLSEMQANVRAGMSLPSAAYTDPLLFQHDLKHVFFKQWLFAGHACEIASPGDYILFEVGNESIILIREKNDRISALANVCRHRGSRICSAASGHMRKIICPYHQWTYGLNGELLSARWMQDDFDPAKFPLKRLHVRNVAGLIYVCFAETPPDFDAGWEAITSQIRLNHLEEAHICLRNEYTIQANWKVVFENNRECYHCRGGHPEFCLSNFDVGVNGDRRQDHQFEQAKARLQEVWERIGQKLDDINFPGGAGYRIARFPLKEGYLTESVDGKLVAPLMGSVPEAGIGSLRIITLPNSWIHVNCDYAVTTRLIPIDAETTRAVVTYLVSKDAIRDVDFDPDRVAAVWRATSEQDWELCERMQQGVRSKFYQPGPYSLFAENGVIAFLEWYLQQIDV